MWAVSAVLRRPPVPHRPRSNSQRCRAGLPGTYACSRCYLRSWIVTVECIAPVRGFEGIAVIFAPVTTPHSPGDSVLLLDPLMTITEPASLSALTQTW